jgi:ABC-type dipeptide/oligopeptide/nickel transport system ATPase component
MIGRNGSGKSTLLRDIVAAFRSIADTGRTAARSSRAWKVLDRLHVAADGSAFEIAPYRKEKSPLEAPASLSQRGLPTKVIAVSFTPYDKFSARDDVIVNERRDSEEEAVDPFYVYLGLKTENGGSSPRARLLRAVSRLTNRGFDQEADDRIANTLAAIGYLPMLNLKFRVSVQLEEYIRAHRMGKEISPSARERFSKLTPHNGDHILGYGDEISEAIINRRVSMFMDFGNGHHHSSINPRIIADLVEKGILTASSVELFKTKGADPVDVLELSSGELNIFSSFLGLAAHLSDGCLVLIDEPENSLHPEWQVRYVEMLEAVLSRHVGCHYIVATHSPLIVSGAAARRSFIVRLDEDPTSLTSQGIADQSPDATLLNAFDVVTERNNYLRQVTLEGLTLLRRGEIRSARGKEILALLQNVYGNISDRDPIKKVVEAILTRSFDVAS